MTIDERLEFLLKSTESLHATSHETASQLQDLVTKLDYFGTKVDLLAEAVKNMVFLIQNRSRRLDKLEGSR